MIRQLLLTTTLEVNSDVADRVVLIALIIVVIGLPLLLWSVGVSLPGFTPTGWAPQPISTSGEDREVVWLNTPTSWEAWGDFVSGLRKLESLDAGEFRVDISNAYPEQTTAVPEVRVGRNGFTGRLVFRWYKLTNEATTEAWVAALAEKQDPAPLAIIGGWSSDRALELVRAMASRSRWHGDPPLVLLTAATVDKVDPNPDEPSFGAQKNLAELYPGRTFRLCFSNAQMVQTVTDFVLQDPTLRPGSITWPGLRAIGTSAGGTWAIMPQLADMARHPTVFPLAWQDDPFSTDLSTQFQEHVYLELARQSDPTDTQPPKSAPRVVKAPTFQIPYSVGGFSRVNAGEAAAVRDVIRNLPPSNERSLLIIPTVTAPARRVLLALSERVPQAGRRLVAVTGDGMSVNAVFRDADINWPARSIPIPLVMFAHNNPFGWATPGGHDHPHIPVAAPVDKSSTQDRLLYAELGRLLTDAAIPHQRRVVESTVSRRARTESRSGSIRGIPPCSIAPATASEAVASM